ncbi:ATP-binding protein [Candidatus Laterigemmans baculatus]|uniref:ATP-binding protein n=1 Tax=Candidatus Laterigemmans baculatus TaxID=2770505 RepID=UPI0013DBAA03|nr:ATP-binding protein [Candidatus Laterigemmans baculatus]
MAEHDSGGWTLERTIPSETAIGSELVSGLLAAMQEYAWPAAELFHVQLAYEEAIVNAIRHGNEFAADKTVQVRLSCTADEVRIEIADMGPGFDPDSLPDPRAEDRLEVPGGRGVMLIHELMSEVTYHPPGNRVTMIKRRPPSP